MAALLTALPLTLGLAACGDDVEAPEETKPVTETAPQASGLAGKDWIGVYDDVQPARWLASRKAGHDVAQDDPSVEEMRLILEKARTTYGTAHRMIANRAVQLEGMIAQRGWQPEKAPEIIVSLSEIGGPNSRLEGFGQAAQSYYVLRERGLSREEALEELKHELSQQ